MRQLVILLLVLACEGCATGGLGYVGAYGAAGGAGIPVGSQALVPLRDHPFGRFIVTVKRLSRNIYQDLNSKAIIQTNLCLELAGGEEAVVNWEGPVGDSWIIFRSTGDSCQVVSLRH